MQTRTANTTSGRLGLLAALAMSLTMLVGAQAFAQEASPLIEQINNGNWPSDEETQELLDELYYQQAIQVYMSMLPALNVIGMRDGSEAEFGAGYNVLPQWQDRMDSRASEPSRIPITLRAGSIDM